MIFSTNQLALGRPGKKAILKRRFGGFGIALRGNAMMHTRLKRGFVLEPQKNGRGRAGFGGFESDLRENNTKQSMGGPLIFLEVGSICGVPGGWPFPGKMGIRRI